MFLSKPPTSMTAPARELAPTSVVAAPAAAKAAPPRARPKTAEERQEMLRQYVWCAADRLIICLPFQQCLSSLDEV
jgi:hypothetical protein